MAGISNYGIQAALAALLPNGTNAWVALFTVEPAADGTGGTEVSGSTGYARKVFTDWITILDSGTYYRTNNTEVDFGFTVSTDISGIVAWGIYDAVTSGNLLASGPTLNSSGDEISVDMTSGDDIKFQAQGLKLGIDS